LFISFKGAKELKELKPLKGFLVVLNEIFLKNPVTTRNVTKSVKNTFPQENSFMRRLRLDDPDPPKDKV
jgi:hypothetical protein